MKDLWVVLELKSDSDLEVVSTVCDEYNEALITYYQKLLAALEGDVPEHTILIMDKLGQVPKMEVVYHSAEPKEEDSEGEVLPK